MLSGTAPGFIVGVRVTVAVPVASVTPVRVWRAEGAAEGLAGERLAGRRRRQPRRERQRVIEVAERAPPPRAAILCVDERTAIQPLVPRRGGLLLASIREFDVRRAWL